MKIRNESLLYMLALRCVVFLLVFIAGALVTDKKIDEISNWRSIIANIVNIITMLVLLTITQKQKSHYWELVN